MNDSFLHRQRFPGLFRFTLWLLLAILCAGHPAEVSAAKSLERSVGSLSAPAVKPDLVAAPLQNNQVKHPLPLSPPLVLPAGIPVPEKFLVFNLLKKPDSPLLPSPATCTEPYLPRPPPTV